LARLLKEAGYLIKNARDEPSAKLHLWRQSIRLVVVDNMQQSEPSLELARHQRGPVEGAIRAG
jgi:hypothetical protein